MNNESKKVSETVEEPIVAWIGLDWADNQHQIAHYDEASSKLESYVIKQTPEALQEWLSGLRTKYRGAKIAVVLEQSRGPILYALMKYEFLVIYPVNPQAFSNYRKAFSTSRAKSDAEDAPLLMEMVRKHPQRFRPWKPDDVQTRSLQLLTEARRNLVDSLTSLTNQLTAQLKSYYPQALEWAGDLNTRQACEFLEKWPSLQILQLARPSSIKKFYQGYGRTSAAALDERLKQIRNAAPLSDDDAVVLAGTMMVRAIVAQIRPLINTIEEFEDQIKQLFQSHPDRPIFESLPGAGRALAPRLIAAFGSDRDRWTTAAEIQALSGIAPVTEQSGQQRWVHWRWGCPTFMRQTFHEFASHSVPWCDWAKAYYENQKKIGKSHHAAVRALAYKWIRIIFRCWKTRTQYSDELYVASLCRRQSPLYPKLATLVRTKPGRPRRTAPLRKTCENLVDQS